MAKQNKETHKMPFLLCLPVSASTYLLTHAHNPLRHCRCYGFGEVTTLYASSSNRFFAKTIRGFDGHERIDLELPFIKKVISSFFSFELTFLYFCTRPFVGGAFIVAGILGVIGISSLMCCCVFVAH